MKKSRKFFLILFLMILIMDISHYPSNANIPSKQESVLKSEHSIVPLKDIIVWKYMKINNKWYKRQYNTTTRQWIGNWILVD